MRNVWAMVDTDVMPNDALLKQKTESALGAMQDLLNWIVSNKAELDIQSFWAQSMQDPRAIHNAHQMLARLGDVMTKVAANINGYHKEVQWASKQIKKKEDGSSNFRRIVFGQRGDIAVDYGDGKGAAVQSKSCFADSYKSVDDHIKMAALQLTGTKVAAETPLMTDRRIIDISIRSPNNRWPQTDNDFSQLTIDMIVSRVHKLVTNYAPKRKGYNKLREASSIGYVNQSTSNGNKVRSRVVSNVDNKTIVDFVVKIRWDIPRNISFKGVVRSVRIITTRTIDTGFEKKTDWVLSKG